MNWANYWWNSIHGPERLIETAVRDVAGGLSVLITNAARMPWPDVCRDRIYERIEQSDLVRAIHRLDFEREAAPPRSPEEAGEWLIKRWNRGEGYRPHRDKPWEYIKRVKMLNKAVVWIYGVSGGQLAGWNKLCRELKGICSFIIESPGANSRVSGTELIDAASYLTEYDDLVLASMVVSQRDDVPEFWRRYLSDLAVQAFGGQEERITAFAEEFDIEEPPESFDGIAPQAVWRAQLRSAYPLLEENRVAFVAKYEREIQQCLPELQFQEAIFNPYEAELGLLWYLTDPKREEQGKKRLFVPLADYNWLYALHDARNKLAHGDTLLPGVMGKLLKGNVL
jgi:hypothetical protein